MSGPSVPGLNTVLEKFPTIDFEWTVFTKEGLSSTEVFVGLLDHGLFADKVPPCFTTKGLADFAAKEMGDLLKECDGSTLKKIDKCAHDHIRYEALRDINIPRHLGIPHPEAYAVQAFAIEKHWKEIALHCNKPSPPISRIHVRHVGDGSIFEMNYKGDERYQLQEEDIEWRMGAQFLVKADIASCFHSMYTHSIPWALHDKSVAKKITFPCALYGNLLDKCTQNTRDKQTNGILIGPHASNIISEIILSQVDAELQAKGYTKISRYIDDYEFYAESFDHAEKFIRDLGMSLRSYELSLNEKKTCIYNLPRPSDENWIQALNRFVFPRDGEVTFSVVRSFLDLALELSQAEAKSTPLNYAIKSLAGSSGPRNLNSRAKRLYAQEAMNLAVAFPYLAGLLDRYVFDQYWHDGLKGKIAEFSLALIKLGVRKLYPDTISHALYYALKHDIELDIKEDELKKILELDDCIANVLLLEYANTFHKDILKKALKSRGEEIKQAEDRREGDRHWLLIYQLWSVQDLEGNGQAFLASLKSEAFNFLQIPKSS